MVDESSVLGLRIHPRRGRITELRHQLLRPWSDPYTPIDELRAEIAQGVVFSGFFDGPDLAAVMGLQHVADVVLIRHAYTRTADQRRGLGTALLHHLRTDADRPTLIGTWRAATWAIRFYEKHGFRLVPPAAIGALLARYWTVPERQIAESVVLADERAASEYIVHPDRHTQYRVAAILCLGLGGSGVAIVVAAVARWMRSARAATRTGGT